MARVRSIIKLSGTLDGITFVDSSTYGAHSRAKRGTYTPITLAEGMKNSCTEQIIANTRASLLFDPLKEFAMGFRNGALWNRLVSKFRKQQKEKRAFTFADFNLMEIRPDHPTHSHGNFRLTANSTHENVTVHTKDLKKQGQLNTPYKISLLRVATADLQATTYPIALATMNTNKYQCDENIPFNFEPLPIGVHVIYCLKCEALENDIPKGLMTSKGIILLNG